MRWLIDWGAGKDFAGDETEWELGIAANANNCARKLCPCQVLRVGAADTPIIGTDDERSFGGSLQYLASLKEARDMLSSFMGQTILVKGNPVISDGSPQTYFSATTEQRANPYTNYLLGSQPPGSIIPGMELRDQSRLTYLATPNGAAQPVYPLEEWLIGGKLVDTLIGTLGRLLSSTDIAILGRASVSAGGNISAQQITRESTQLRLTSADRTLLSQLDTVSSTALQGDLREYVVNNYFVRNGFKSMEGKCGGNNCFDGVYIKGDTLYVVEVKPLKNNGSIKLSAESGNLPTQMSDGWIESAIDRLGRGSSDQRATAAAIRPAIEENRLVKIVTGVNSNGVSAVRVK